MQPSKTAILSQTEMFDNLTETQYELVAFICEPVTYDSGHVLVRENEVSDDMYVIARGGVEVLMDPKVVGDADNSAEMESVLLTELRQGQVVGEISLVDQGVRSATLRVSQDDTLLLSIQRKRLMLLCDTYPELGYKIMRNLAADLALKIRNTDLTFRQYQILLSQAGRPHS